MLTSPSNNHEREIVRIADQIPIQGGMSPTTALTFAMSGSDSKFPHIVLAEEAAVGTRGPPPPLSKASLWRLHGRLILARQGTRLNHNLGVDKTS